MAFKLSEESKKILDGGGNTNSGVAPVNKPDAPKGAPVNPPSSGGKPVSAASGFKLSDKGNEILNSNISVNAPSKFIFADRVYQDDGSGSYIKAGYKKKQSDIDRITEERTGHETLFTDLEQSALGGIRSWGASQLSTLATVPLAVEAAINKDNYYQPKNSSGLWKMLQASSANTREAGETAQNSKEGRGKIGSTVMDVTSNAVMNGIDVALKSIPFVGQVLGTASFMSRSFGGKAQEMRDQGKSVGTQVLAGVVSAGIEQFTESMSKIAGVKDYLGQDTAGWLDNISVGLESAIAKKAGPVIAKMVTSMGSEAVEEMLADVLNPVIGSFIEKRTKDSKLFGDYEAEEWQGVGNMLYDGLIGALSAVGGGVTESASALDTYRNEANSDNALYSTILRQEYESNKAMRRDARGVQIGSIFDAVNTLFNKETGETLTERASKAAGTFVRNKDVGKVLAQRDEDFVRVVNQVADKFAEQSFANEDVDKDVLKAGVVNFFMNGDFSAELNSVDGAKGQIEAIAKEIMKADAEKRLEQAKTKKDKSREAYYSSLLANLVNSSFAEEQLVADTASEVTEAQTYGYTQEELEADIARRQAEAEEAAAPKFTKNEQNRIDKIFSDATKSMRLTDSEKDQRLRDAILARAEAEGREVVETASGNKTTYKIKAKSEDVTADAVADTTAEDTRPEQVESEAKEEPTQKLPQKDRQKINRLFSGKQSSIKIASDERGNALLEAIRQKAQEEGRTVSVENGKASLTQSTEGTTAEQEATTTQQNIDNATASDYNNSIETVENTGENANGEEAGTVSAVGGEAGEGVPVVQRENDTGISGEGNVRGADTGDTESRLTEEDTALETLTKKKGIVNVGLQSSTDSAFYSSSLQAAKDADPAHGNYVSFKDADEIQHIIDDGGVVKITEDGSAGVIVKADGDIVAVFKNRDTGKSGSLPSMLITAIANGGTKLDCYGIGLVNKYAQAGFRPVSRVIFNPQIAMEYDGWTQKQIDEYQAKWKHAPDVIFMVSSGDSANDVAQKFGEYTVGYTWEALDKLPTFDGEDGYDNAMAYRDGLLQQGTATVGEEQAATEETEAEQPKAERRKSPSEANEIAEKTFGKEGRLKTTRVVEAFNKLKNPYKKSADGEYGKHGKIVDKSMAKMLEKLKDVNDGYGTVKNVYNVYRNWRDNKIMSAYYNADTANAMYKLVADGNEKNWEFDEQEQADFAQAYEEVCNAMIANINNVNRDSNRIVKLRADAIANKLNIKSDGFISKAIQRFIRYQITTDTAMRLFGGFKGSGEFYKLGKDIKDAVAKRMVEYVDAYSYFDSVKGMNGFKDFVSNKKYKLDPQSDSLERNPFEGQSFTMQQIVAMKRLLLTMEDTVLKGVDASVEDRVKGIVVKDSQGNSTKISLGDITGTDSGDSIGAIIEACDDILNQDTPAAECARAYNKACDDMFKKVGKKVSDVKKAITGNGLTLVGENYTPLLWEKEDGTAEYNFNRSDRIKSPSFTYERTDAEGYLVVQDISNIVDKYVEKAADYIGTAQLKDSLARINHGTSLTNEGKGLNSVLAENFGKDAGVWFDEYVKDLTEYGENDSIWAALRRNMQKGALIGSPSVMMKQTSSYWSAMGLLSPEALLTAYRWKVGVKAADNSEYNKLLKYRHVSDKIDPTLTEIIKDVEKYGKLANSRVAKLFTNGISEQDYKTIDNLYTATMIDTYLKNQDKGAEYFSSGDFQDDIDNKFTEVMMRSQPMFDTELRAEYARTDNELVKMTSMFRTQQTQNLNLIATAIGEYNASKGTGEQAEKAQVLRRTVAGQASAALSLSLLSVAADIMLHGLKKYRGDGDDDDKKAGDGKIELERILGRIGLNTIETGAGTVWFGDSVAKWLIDRMSGGETSEYYGVNFGPLTTFENILESIEYAAKSPTPSNIKNVATNISQLLGIPINNAYRIVNSAIMYTADVTGNNEHKYDDILKMWGNNARVSEKNETGRNMLVESGMARKEANALVKLIDEDGDGLSKDELSEWYIEHPEDAEKVSLLWESMGWKTSFSKTQKSLDKKRVYRSNPLYAEMDEDESGSVSKSEMMAYAIENEDKQDEIAGLYKEQGFKGTFRSALKSAENEMLKETAEDAFYDGDYNVLFDTVNQMKNGKTWLTNMVKDEYDEYEDVSNPIIRFMIDANRSAKEVDAAVEEYGAKKFIPQYKALRAAGLSPSASLDRIDGFDANKNGSITQAEVADYYKAHPDEEAMIAEFWAACGWSTTWAKYKKSKKIK